MPSLEDHLRKCWLEVRKLHNKGKLDEYYHMLEFDTCSGDLKRKAEKLNEVSRSLEKYFGLPRMERYDTEKDIMLRIKEKYNDKKRGLRDCIERKIEENNREFINAARVLGVRMNGQGLEDRFEMSRFTEEYDREFFALKKRFDSVDAGDREYLKTLQEMAEQSQRLTEKYKSVGDSSGVSKAAVLHEDIERAAKELVPVYNTWRKRRISVGIIALAAILGFWKGDYVKDQVKYFFGTKVSSLAGNNRSTDYPDSLTEIEGTVNFDYALYFDEGTARLYDTRTQKLVFNASADYSENPKGLYSFDSKKFEFGKFQYKNLFLIGMEGEVVRVSKEWKEREREFFRKNKKDVALYFEQ